ncbi:M48 family metalloprotease [Permianibacter aggregans]|nr:M48 family metalloprotease [Permianibacter aggregans]QGX41482.1 M48 family peptidase [Permianibacter aggregans]
MHTWFQRILTGTLCAMLPIIAYSSELPDMGSSTSKVLSEQYEQLVGDAYMRQLRQFLPVIDDPELVEYINDLGFRLVANAPDAQGRQFYFFLVNDSSLNAFALPGGYIGVHSELFLMAENESELAGVLAHEIAHVTQRHLARRLERQQQLSFPTLAAILGGLILAAANPNAGIAAMSAAQAGAQQMLINHTRANESEADRIGMQILSEVNLDPYGMATFFEKMEQTTRYLRLPPPVLLTHPVSQQRMADARLRAAEFRVGLVPASTRLYLMQTKMRALVEKEVSTLERAQETLDKRAPDDVLTLYSRALLRMRQDKPIEALTLAETLRQREPKNLSFLLLATKAMNALNQHDAAEKLLAKELELQPNHHALTVAYAQTLMANNKAAAAREKLLAYVSLPDTEPNVYQLLAAAQQASGHPDEVHESQGLYLLSIGDLHGALAQFEVAVRSYSDDPYASARINARIKQIQNILMEQRRRR